MAWTNQHLGRWEYQTIGPYRFPHERDAACNKLCATDGAWQMHSSDVHRATGEYFAIMYRWVPQEENA